MKERKWRDIASRREGMNLSWRLEKQITKLGIPEMFVRAQGTAQKKEMAAGEGL